MAAGCSGSAAAVALMAAGPVAGLGRQLRGCDATQMGPPHCDQRHVSSQLSLISTAKRKGRGPLGVWGAWCVASRRGSVSEFCVCNGYSQSFKRLTTHLVLHVKF